MKNKLKQFWQTVKRKKRINQIYKNQYITDGVKVLQIRYECGINVTLNAIQKEKEFLKKRIQKTGSTTSTLASLLALEGLKLKILCKNK